MPLWALLSGKVPVEDTFTKCNCQIRTRQTVKREAPNEEVSDMDKTEEKPRRQIVLVLQGGGALGAYQAGVYQALHEAGLEPDWVIGTSIGAINAAIIAGNPPERRVARLQTFWQRITDRTVWAHPPDV